MAAKNQDGVIPGFEQLLCEGPELYRSIIEYCNDLIWTLDMNGNFTYINKCAEGLTGHKRKDLLGKTFVPLIVKEDLPKVLDVFKKIVSGGTTQYDVSIICSDNSILPLAVSTSPVFSGGKIIGTVSFGRDIRERRKMEIEMRTLNEDLKSKVAELERFNKLAVGRELKMIELKKRIDELEARKK